MKTEEVKLSKTINPKKLPPLFDNRNVISYDNMYANALPLIWKTQRQLCSSSQNVSYRYVRWLSSTFKESHQNRTYLSFSNSQADK